MNGKIIGSGNAYGTVLSFKCETGFKLMGSIERRCQENGLWSGADVTCTGILEMCPSISCKIVLVYIYRKLL